MAGMGEWRQRGVMERSILFGAALLHDVAKPYCTREDADGIVSPGHALKGELLARKLLYQDLQGDFRVPFDIRETIAKLVRFHGLPLFFMEKPNPAKAVLAASQMVRMDWLALLAEADVLGRSCPDQGELLERITLFREFCREEGCFEAARLFPDNFSRFEYFQKENRFPDFQAYDDTKCEMILMSGLPGAGKDTWIARHLPDYSLISLDAIREEQGISPEAAQGKVVCEARERARVLLRQKSSFIWNATNTTRMLRQQLVSLATSYGAKVKIVYLEAPYPEILRRNRERSACVPESVIDHLVGKLEVPDVTEAHEVQYWVG